MSVLRNLLDRVINRVEVVGNKLPHPITIFVMMTFLVIALSGLFGALGAGCEFERIAPVAGVPELISISAVSLMSREGIRYLLEHLVSNFTSFAPLGSVLVTMLGIGVAEGSGLIAALLKRTVAWTPRRLLSFGVVFLGVMSSVASDAGYVVLIPLGALIFRSVNRHPLAGLAAAFAGVSGGFSANLLLGSLEPLLAGITQEAARMIQPGIAVPPTGNYYFMAASTLLIAVSGAWVTDKVVEPRLQHIPVTAPEPGSAEDTELTAITGEESRGLRFAAITLALAVGVVIWGLVPRDGWLRGNAGEVLGHSPFMIGLVALIFALFFLPGLAYGIGAGTIRSDRAMERCMSGAMSSMGGYIVLAFVAAQFIGCFNYSKLGIILAVHAAEWLRSIQLTGFPLIALFVTLAAFINLFVGSASAKWAIMAPVFIPLLMQLGYTPEFGQLAYRVGDSVTNIISPLMPYFAVVIAFAARYDKKLGIGTLVAMMLPYSIIFYLCWLGLLGVWFLLKLPIGPGVGILMP